MSDTIGKFILCTKCKEYHFSDQKCAPIFYAWLVDDWDDDDTSLEDVHSFARVIRTRSDHSEAAEMAGARIDGEGDYSIIGGNESEISVLKGTDEDMGKVQTFIVSGRTVPEYSARKKGGEGDA